MAANFGGNDDEVISEINITPFVDIILVVLIIFMLATPVIMSPGIKVNLPQAASGDATTPSQLNISLTASGDVFINGKKASESEVSSIAGQKLKENPDTQAIIAADKDVPHGKVIGILDKIKSVGITKFAISIQKE